MATIRSYTTVEQSRKLAEFLPLESADMDYIPVVNIDGEYSIAVNVWDNDHVIEEGWIPCWSLTALLEEIPDTIINIVGEDLKLHIDKDNLQYSLFYENEYTGDMFEIETELYDDMIDACYEMILKLHEQKLL